MKEQNTMEIDVFHLFKILWKRKILIALVAIVAGALAFAYSAFIVKPEFRRGHGDGQPGQRFGFR